MKQDTHRQRALLWLLVAIYACVAPGCCTAIRPGLTGRTEREQNLAVVEVRATCPLGNGYAVQGHGSGVVVTDRTVLTALHVLVCLPTDKGAAVEVRTLDGTIKAKATRLSADGDLARLELAEPIDVATARIGPRPRRGDIVCFSAGRPKRNRKCGLVEDVADAPPGDVAHGAITIPGNSGSGVYDEAGRLVGIVTHRQICPQPTCGGRFTSLEARVWMVR